MEVGSVTGGRRSYEYDERKGIWRRGWKRVKTIAKESSENLVGSVKKIKKVGEDDPRRVIHSLKVGFAITIVSLLYYYRPLYDSFGLSAMWAVMTVVVVFEFSVGATLGKGLNRVFATMLAGALGVGAHHLARSSGHTAEPIVLGILVFLQASASTFLRFFPTMKERYDYGLLIFILTFSLVSVSGFRDDEIFELARKRMSTILIGSAACIVISIVVCPVWAGQDLHNLVALNLDRLSIFLEGFEDACFQTSGGSGIKDDETFLQVYKSVINSKCNEESSANFARWEPGHGRFQFRHPWKQYLKIGGLTRQCAYRIEALNGYRLADFQAPAEIGSKIREECTKMSSECGKALKDLSLSVKEMKQPSSSSVTHLSNSRSSAKNLRSLFKSVVCGDCDLLAVIPAVTVSSLLIDILECTEKIAESIQELASMADFKTIKPTVSPEKSEFRRSESEKPEPFTIAVKIDGYLCWLSYAKNIRVFAGGIALYEL